jgi:hypothetical protein
MLGAITSVALADLVEWANTPWPGSKWFQPPELVQPWGVDYASNVDPYEGEAIPWVVVADDWRCTSTQPVAGFRWWGSYFTNSASGQKYTIANLLGFYVMIFADIPAGAAASHPGQFLKQEYFTIAELGYGEVGHQLPIATDSTGNMVYEYFGIFDNYFMQQGTPSNPVIYWASIVAELNPSPDVDENVWGWHASVLGPEYEHNLDDAISIGDFNFLTHGYSQWTAIEYQGHSLDMAFEVIPEPTALMLIAPGVLGLFALIRRRK